MKDHKTTGKDFRIFKAEFLKWADRFGLKGWEFYFFHEKLDKDCYAHVIYDTGGRVIRVSLNRSWGEIKPTQRRVQASAFHEVCELLLARLETLAYERFVRKAEIEEEVHHIIRTLENVVFDQETCKNGRSRN